jgi:hypothetical protein
MRKKRSVPYALQWIRADRNVMFQNLRSRATCVEPEGAGAHLCRPSMSFVDAKRADETRVSGRTV